jgi:hypothetical protein
MNVYLCRWPNGDLSLVYGQTLKEVFDTLDEIDDPDGCEMVRIKQGAVHFHLSDEGQINFESLSERLLDDLDKVYPVLDDVRTALLDAGVQPESEEWQQKLREGVRKERARELTQHNLSTFDLVYGDDVRRVQQEALRNPRVTAERKDQILEDLETRSIKARSTRVRQPKNRKPRKT